MAGKQGRKVYNGRWRRVRRQVLERDGWRCTACGAARRLEVHHEVPIAKGGKHYDISNLVTLCYPCHAARHKPADPARDEWKGYLDAL